MLCVLTATCSSQLEDFDAALRDYQQLKKLKPGMPGAPCPVKRAESRERQESFDCILTSVRPIYVFFRPTLPSGLCFSAFNV